MNSERYNEIKSLLDGGFILKVVKTNRTTFEISLIKSSINIPLFLVDAHTWYSLDIKDIIEKDLIISWRYNYKIWKDIENLGLIKIL